MSKVQVICTLENASDNISGVKFTPLEDGTGLISELIPDGQAEVFLSIPGYALHQKAESRMSESPVSRIKQ